MENIPHLHTHTYHSVLDGVASPRSYLEKCDELEIPAIAFTDHGNMGSHSEASIESESFKTKVILGSEVYLVPSIKRMNLLRSSDKDEDKEKLAKYRSSRHAVLLAKNSDGYRNLIRINNSSWRDGFYYRNRTDISSLHKDNEGLICLSGCQSGVVSKYLLEGKKKTATKVAKKMKNVFGNDFYLEIMFLDMEIQDKLNGMLVKLGKKLDIPLVLTNDVHFINKGDHRIQKVLMHLATKGGFVYEAKSLFLKRITDFEDDFKNQTTVPQKSFVEAVDNTFKIADLCNYKVETGNLYFPKFDHTTHPEYSDIGGDKEVFFKNLILKRAKKILGKKLKIERYRKRLFSEYKTLVELGAIDYFLIVDDLLIYIRNNGAFSVIRGSANGSLIAFVLGFGLIDPIRHEVLFERFISEYRSLNDVDIDIDVRSEFRQKAIEYLKEKYGTDRVVTVGSYNRMQLKGAIKDITRVFKERLDKKIVKAKTEADADRLAERQEQFTFPVINRITSPMTGDLSVKSARSDYEIFDTWYKKNKKIVDRYIVPVIGNIKNVSLHPAGVIITPGHVDELLPIRTQVNPHKKSERVVATVWENSHTGREDLNEVGMMALDILAVRTLSVVSDVIELVKVNKGKKIDLYKIDLEDKKTFSMFNKRELTGVFQFSGSASSQVIAITPITDFNDLVAITAIARPGALGAHAEIDYSDRKKDPTLVKYDHHSLEPVLKDSLGVLVFSEHILRTASEFAGMHPKEADSLRKIIKGKNPDLFKKYKKVFIDGAIKKWKGEKDIEKTAQAIWKKFSKAGNYLFPRGHSASYALLGYICQYLKVHYPAEFFACHLSYTKQEKYGDVKDVAEEVYGIKFLMPNINTPTLRFEATVDGIMWPLNALKSVGDKAIPSIIKNAPFSSFEDFFSKVDKRVCNKRVVENMIVAGAFKDFGNKKAIIAEYKRLRKDKKPDLPVAFNSKEDMAIALEGVFGFEIQSVEKLFAKKLKPYGKFTSSTEFADLEQNDQAMVFGKVERFTPIMTQKGDKMAFASLKNKKTVFNITLFPDAFNICKKVFRVGNVLVVSGTKNIYRNEGSIVLKTVGREGEPKKLASGSWAKKL